LDEIITKLWFLFGELMQKIAEGSPFFHGNPSAYAKKHPPKPRVLA